MSDVSPAPIDINALRKLKDMIGGDAEDLAELLGDFLDALPIQLIEMRRAEVARDWPKLRLAAHSAKSNARDLGAGPLADLCGTLELACRAGAPPDAAHQITTIEAQADIAMAALKEVTLHDV